MKLHALPLANRYGLVMAYVFFVYREVSWNTTFRTEITIASSIFKRPDWESLLRQIILAGLKG